MPWETASERSKLSIPTHHDVVTIFKMHDLDLYDLDESHPIPDLGVIDINGVRKGGGSDLVIIIASPLAAEQRSLQRLMRKLEVYLQFMRSDQFRAEAGTPTPENTRIIVKIHRESCPEAFELLRRNREWVRNNDATLEIDPCLPESSDQGPQ